MQKLKASDLVDLIAQLGTQTVYDYHVRTTRLRIINVTRPEGPIIFKRWDRSEPEANATQGRISANQLTTAAAAFANRPNHPIHFDTLYRGGGNSRSVLETLLAYTPHFFICCPQRTDFYTGAIRSRLKHIM